MSTKAASNRVAATIMPTSPEQRRISAFEDWFASRGGRYHPDLYFATDETTGLSLFSRREHPPTGDAQKDDHAAAREGFVAVEVPVDLVITPWEARETIIKCFSRDSNDEEDDSGSLELRAKEWVTLYVFLARLALERNGGYERDSAKKRDAKESSPLDALLDRAPYIDLLPEDIATPLHFRKEELQLLVGSPLYYHALESRRDTRRSCRKAVRWLLSRLDGLEENDKDKAELRATLEPLFISLKDEQEEGKEEYSHDLEAQSWGLDEDAYKPLKLFRWATTIVDSRAFPPRLVQGGDRPLTGPILVPGLDAFNHARQARVTWTYHQGLEQIVGTSEAVAGPKKAAKVTLTIHSGLHKDKQVFNSYGPKSNEDFLASYAFVDPSMQDDVVSLVLGDSRAANSNASTSAGAQRDNEKGSEDYSAPTFKSSDIAKDEQEPASLPAADGSINVSSGDAASPSSFIILPNGKKQHYWKMTDTTCPASLLKEVMDLLPAIEDAQQHEGHGAGTDDNNNADKRQQAEDLQTKGEALEIILDLLEAKNRAFLGAQTQIEQATTTLAASQRQAVIDNVMIYRKGQGKILKKAIKIIGKDMDKVEEELNSIM